MSDGEVGARVESFGVSCVASVLLINISVGSAARVCQTLSGVMVAPLLKLRPKKLHVQTHERLLKLPLGFIFPTRDDFRAEVRSQVTQQFVEKGEIVLLVTGCLTLSDALLFRVSQHVGDADDLFRQASLGVQDFELARVATR